MSETYAALGGPRDSDLRENATDVAFQANAAWEEDDDGVEGYLVDMGDFDAPSAF